MSTRPPVTRTASRLLLGGLLALAAVGAAASVAGAQGTATLSVEAIGGALQSAKVGTAFSAPLTVSVTCDGTALAGVPVTFTAPSSGPSATFLTTDAASQTVDTGSTGQAESSQVVAGDTAGSYTVTAAAVVPTTSSSSCAGQSETADFPLTNTAGTPSGVSVVSGSDQQAAVGTAFADPLVVLVDDQYGNPVPGVAVTFAVQASDGATATFATGGSSVSVATTASGEAASPTLTAGSTAGAFTVVAQVQGAAEPAVFDLTDVPGPPATVTAGVGASQQADLGTAFAIPLAVTVVDADHNPVPGVVVTFTAPASEPTGTFASGGTSVQVTTDSDGIAVAPTFTAGDQPGGYVVTATVAGVSQPAVFALVNEETSGAGAPSGPSPSSPSPSGAPVPPGAGTSVVAVVGDGATGGYWLVGADGAVFAYGAPYLGGANAVPGGAGGSVVSAAATADGGGYWEVTSSGAVFAFGDARYLGGANALG